MSDISSGTHTSKCDTIGKGTVVSRPTLVRTPDRQVVTQSHIPTIDNDLADLARPVLRRSNDHIHTCENHTKITKNNDLAIDILEEYFLREHK